jgi:hypothetical protein
MDAKDWLEPWWSTEDAKESYLRTFSEQLARETASGHQLYQVPVRLIGRGNGDDALFALEDGSGRVAQVHLVWQGRQRPPSPPTAVFANLDEWREASMLPEHLDWIDE